jgi:hypothetical protein
MIEHEHRDPRRAEADAALRAFLTETFRKHRLSRPQIAERLSELLGEKVSTSRLDSFTASTKVSARMPAYFLRAISVALDSDEILLFLARPRLRKQIELAEQLRELRRLCDELLRMPALNAKHSHSLPAEKSKVPGNGIPADEKRNGKAACA